jgi:type II secretory pathway pseudopilin PulG
VNHLKKIAVCIAVVLIEQTCFGMRGEQYNSQTQVQYANPPQLYQQSVNTKQTYDWKGPNHILGGSYQVGSTSSQPTKPQADNWGSGNKLGSGSDIPVFATDDPKDMLAIANFLQTTYLETTYNEITAIPNIHKIFNDNKISLDNRIIIINELIRNNENNTRIINMLENIKKSLEKKAGIKSSATGQHTQNYLYAKATSNMTTDQAAKYNADRMIEESYISPDMQLAVFKLFNRPFVINKITGAPVFLDIKNNPTIVDKQLRSMPSIQEILAKDTNNKEALQAALEAIDIAMKVATLEAGFDANKQNYYWYQNADKKLVQELQKYKSKIVNKLNSSTTNSQEYIYNVNNINEGLDDSDFIVLTPEQAEDLATKYSLKNLNGEIGAKILILQCFIAQQHHLKDINRMSQLKMNPITFNIPDRNVADYLFYGSNMTIEKIIEAAQGLHDKKQKHSLITHLYQAALTALDIAQRAYPYSLIRSRNTIVQELQSQVDEIKKLYINPELGGNKADQDRQLFFDNLALATKVGAGVLAAGAVAAVGVYAQNNPLAVRKINENIHNSFNNNIIKPLTTTATNLGDTITTGVEDALQTIQQTITPQVTLTDKLRFAAEDVKTEVENLYSRTKTFDPKAASDETNNSPFFE